MASQLVKHVWCDHHAEVKQEEIEAEEHSVTIDGSVVEIDLCAECFTPLAELRAFLELYGRVNGKRQRRGADSPEAMDCPQCGKTLSSRAGVMSHMRNQHGITLAQYEEGTEADGVTCAECGFTAKSPGGLAVHLARKHRATEAGAA